MQRMKLTKENINKLIKEQSEYPCLASIYIPVHKVTDGANVRADKIRLKNAMQEIHEELKECDYPKDMTDSFMQGAQELHDDNDFWQNREHGLAVFLTPDKTYAFDMPVEIEPITKFGDMFFLTPLMLTLDVLDSRYVLSINLNEPRLYKATYRTLEDITPEDMPGEMKEALYIDEFEQEQQFHSVRSTSQARAGQTMQHGHGAAKDNKDSEVENYMRLIVKALKPLKQELKRSRLIIAGTPEHIADFEKVTNDYQPDVTLHGNYENREFELQKHVQKQLLEEIERERDEFAATFDETKPERKMQVADPEKIRPAAMGGAVKSMALAAFQRTRDSVSNLNREVYKINLDFDASLIDDIEELAQSVFEKGGRVVGLMSAAQQRSIYALMRY